MVPALWDGILNFLYFEQSYCQPVFRQIKRYFSSAFFKYWPV